MYDRFERAPFCFVGKYEVTKSGSVEITRRCEYRRTKSAGNFNDGSFA
jgi:hypothetical protein